ncbi:MAG: NAD(+) synthase [Akkermansia sp.]
MNSWGYYRVAALVPRLVVGDVDYNRQQMFSAMQMAVEEKGAQVVLFPELCLTAYSCGDLFFQSRLQQAALGALQEWAKESAHWDVISVVGLPLVVNDALFNVAAVVKGGRIWGLVPKSVLPNSREFYEKRQFRAAKDLRVSQVRIGDELVPIGTDLIFSDGADLRLGVEICEDLWSVIPPSSLLAAQGARLILNPSASNELVGKAAYRRDMILQQSGRCLCAYAYASAGVHESTQDVVYGGHALIAENAHLLAESPRFVRELSCICADIDMQRLGNARMSESSFHDAVLPELAPARFVDVGALGNPCDLSLAQLPARPFLPSPRYREERCEDILQIQAAGLAKRVEHSHSQTMVIGVSGGLDSTLALMVCAQACELLGLPLSAIHAVTMPGFGTTGRTYENAIAMCRLLGVHLQEVNIKESCLLHFKDLDFDPSLRTNTYENVQARERTKILMNLANKTGGLVVGTGDLSEIALGWSTYNADHMSMYAVNCSIPKTLIRCLIEHKAKQCAPELAAVLLDVNATPVSPELLPPAEDGTIEQKTEDILGPYDLHDFFLYHFIKYGAETDKLRALALRAFEGEFDAALIERSLGIFIRRFFTQQFKRSCIPDGPKVGTIALSPRGDWRMPSDASANLWLD